MTRETLIKKTISALSKLPQSKVKEVLGFTDHVLKKYEEEILLKGIEKIVSGSESFSFLKDEEDLYSIKDLKERF